MNPINLFVQQSLFGGNDSDTILGNSGSDVIFGGTSNDQLEGQGGNDELFGEGGADDLSGGSGNDTLDGGLGTDQLTGGTGADKFIFSNNFGNDTATDFLVNVDQEVSSFSNINSFSDWLAASSDVGSDVVTTSGANSVTFQGITLGSLDADDFIF